MNTLHDTKLSMLDLVAVREGGTVAEALAIALRTAQHAESARLHPLLAGRTPQHGGHRQLRHGGAGRLHVAGGTQPHPRRLGRRHAAQPCAAGRGRGLRHAGRVATPAASTSAWAAPRAPTSRPCARCAATGSRPRMISRATSASCSACWPPPSPEQTRDRHARRGHRRADLAARLQPVLGPPGGRTRPALRLCFALRAAPAAAGDRPLPQTVSPVDRARKPYVMIGVPLIAAPTDDEAEFLASSTYQRVLGILHGERKRLQPPVEHFAARLHPQERAPSTTFWPPPSSAGRTRCVPACSADAGHRRRRDSCWSAISSIRRCACARLKLPPACSQRTSRQTREVIRNRH